MTNDLKERLLTWHPGQDEEALREEAVARITDLEARLAAADKQRRESDEKLTNQRHEINWLKEQQQALKDSLAAAEAERDAALAQVAALREVVAFHERMVVDPEALSRRDAQMRAEGMRKALDVASENADCPEDEHGRTDHLAHLKWLLRTWQDYPATGRMAATRETAIAELTREIEQMERADHHDPVNTPARPAGSPRSR